MAPRPRKPLSPKSKDFGVRFGIHLRELLDKRKLGPTALVEQMNAHGVGASVEAVKKWLSGDRLPKADDLEGIGVALGLDDYRHVLPSPRKR